MQELSKSANPVTEPPRGRPAADLLALVVSHLYAVNGLVNTIRPVINEQLSDSAGEGQLNDNFRSAIFWLQAGRRRGLEASERIARADRAERRFAEYARALGEQGGPELRRAFADAARLEREAARNPAAEPAKLDELRTLFEKMLDPIEEGLDQQDMFQRRQLSRIDLQIERNARNTLWLSALIGALGGILVVALGVGLLRRCLGLLGALDGALGHSFGSLDFSRDCLSEASSLLGTVSRQTLESLDQTSSSLADVQRIAHDNLEVTRRYAERSEVTLEYAQRGAQAVEEVVEALEHIRTSSAQLTELRDIASAIREQKEVIDTIVFKTQLLAFNASIEAARAGQHGRGFAVVAEEMGSLARTSGEASHRISGLLENTTAKVHEILEDTEQRLVHGRAAGVGLDASFGQVLDSASELHRAMREISDASVSQQEAPGMLDRATSKLRTASGEQTLVSGLVSGVVSRLALESDAMRAAIRQLHDAVGRADALASPGAPAPAEADSAPRSSSAA